MTVSRTICLGFLTLIAIGTLLLLMPFSTATGGWNDFVAAFFTATSAVCVTGLIIVDTGSHYSFLGELLILLLIQVGGLGYMTATTFLLLLLGRKFGLREKIAIQQSLDTPGMSGVVQLVRSIIAVTLLFEISGAIALYTVFAPDYGPTYGVWLAIFHSISAFNNAGFSLFEDSLIQYATVPTINLVIPILIIVGGIGYQVIMETFFWIRDRFTRRIERVNFSLNFKIATSTTAFLLVLGAIAFFFTEFQNLNVFDQLDLGDKIMIAWFASVMPRTAGFNSIDYGLMTTAGLFITIALMFIGGSPGSTAGGIKTTTFRILFSCTKSVLQGKEEVLCYQRQIPFTLVLKAIGVLFGSAMMVVGVTTLIAIADPKIELIRILFEAVSAFATVGLSTGITADLSVWSQIILVVTMYVGRVGVLLLMAAVLGDPSPSAVNYPEENLLVG